MYGENHIHQFDHETAQRFKEAVQEKLEAIGDEFGISMKVDKVKMNGRMSMNMALTACVGSEVKLEDTPSGRMFTAYCGYHDIPEDALGKTVRLGKDLYRIIGWNPSARKYPIEAEQIRSGKVYRLAPYHIKGQV